MTVTQRRPVYLARLRPLGIRPRAGGVLVGLAYLARLRPLGIRPRAGGVLVGLRSGSDRDRGDAGMAFILLIPVLLIIVLHLINATQQLYERREAWAVAAAATRVGNQADPFEVRANRSPDVDESKAAAAIERFVGDAGYRVNEITFSSNANGTTDLLVEIEKDIDYIFPIPSGLADSITGRSESTLRIGVSTEGG